jgi:hypothetical protein
MLRGWGVKGDSLGFGGSRGQGMPQVYRDDSQWDYYVYWGH